VAGVPEDLPVGRVLAERARAQRLTGARPTSPRGVVEAVGSLQAQDLRAARLAYRARGTGFDVGAVGRSRSLVTTWLMRGTLHTVPRADVRWLLELLQPARGSGAARRRALGLDDALLDRALPVVVAALADGPLTRGAVADRVRAAGIALAAGQAPVHLLGMAAREGLVCRGPDAGDEATYALLDAPDSTLDRPAAVVRLAHRYLAGHGPATAADLATWSGLPLRDARAGLAGTDAVAVTIAGEPGFRPAGDAVEEDGTVRLVPAYDEYLLGYRGRSLAVEPRHAGRIHGGGGVIAPAILAGGRVVGRWSQRRSGDVLTVTVEPFGRLPSGLDEEAADLGRYLGLGVELRALDRTGAGDAGT
jgi:Winged helix DNA-binding domain